MLQRLKGPEGKVPWLLRGSPRNGQNSKHTETTGRATFVAGVASGAGLMWALDPNRGRTRRAVLRDKLVRGARKSEHLLEVTYRDTRNRLGGLAAEGRSRVRSDEVDDELIVERVRSKLGQLVTHSAAIEVDADGGRVVLKGPVMSAEIDRLVRGVSSVRGVKEVDNQLDAHDDPSNVPGLQGKGGRARRFTKQNWAPSTRLAATLAGGTLSAYGISRRRGLALGLIPVGVALLGRASTNLPLKRLIGIGAGRRAIDLNKSINISAPVDEVFGFWTRYENFPRFMRHVREVKELEQNRSRWTVEGPAGIPVKFDAVVSVFEANEAFGWKTVPGAAIKHSGLVQFASNPDGGTRLQIRFTYNPVIGGVGHVVAEIFGADPKKQMDDDLARMKTLIETAIPPADAAKPMS